MIPEIHKSYCLLIYLIFRSLIAESLVQKYCFSLKSLGVRQRALKLRPWEPEQEATAMQSMYSSDRLCWGDGLMLLGICKIYVGSKLLHN